MIQALRRRAKFLLDWATSLLFLAVFALLCLVFFGGGVVGSHPAAG